MKVCHIGQTKFKIKPLPTVNISLDISSQRKTNMLIDTGAQISLINNKIIKDKSLINQHNKITIRSIHGSEDTLGDIAASIHKDNTKIPIKLQVTENTFLKEDGILGYDIIGEKAIINGPCKMLTLNSNNSKFDFPINSYYNNDNTVNSVNFIKEVETLQQIEYLNDHEINPYYKTKLQTVKSITHEINQYKIKIKPLQNGQYQPHSLETSYPRN